MGLEEGAPWAENEGAILLFGSFNLVSVMFASLLTAYWSSAECAQVQWNWKLGLFSDVQFNN